MTSYLESETYNEEHEICLTLLLQYRYNLYFILSFQTMNVCVQESVPTCEGNVSLGPFVVNLKKHTGCW